MAPKLLYYAKKKINFKKLVVEDQPIDWKPNGIWYAPEGEWESFLDENFPGTDRPKHLRYKYIYEIKVRHTNMAKPDKSAVLKIRDEKEFDEFTVKYGCTNELGTKQLK